MAISHLGGFSFETVIFNTVCCVVVGLFIVPRDYYYNTLQRAAACILLSIIMIQTHLQIVTECLEDGCIACVLFCSHIHVPKFLS